VTCEVALSTASNAEKRGDFSKGEHFTPQKNSAFFSCQGEFLSLSGLCQILSLDRSGPRNWIHSSPAIGEKGEKS